MRDTSILCGKGKLCFPAIPVRTEARKAELLSQVRELLAELRYLGVSNAELAALVKEEQA